MFFLLRGIFDAALIPVGDGMTGMAGGAVARSVQSAAIQLRQAGELYSRADAALQVAEANAGKVPDAVSIQQYNTAADLFNKAQALEAKATGTFFNDCPIFPMSPRSNRRQRV